MLGKYIREMLVIALLPSVRVADGLQVAASLLIPVTFWALGLPMPDQTYPLVLVVLGYAAIIFLVFRLFIYAPYRLWNDEHARADSLQTEINMPETIQKREMASALAQQRVALSHQLGNILTFANRIIHSIIGSNEHREAMSYYRDYRNNYVTLVNQLAMYEGLRGKCLDALNHADCAIAEYEKHGDYRTDYVRLNELIPIIQREVLYIKES